DRASLDALAGRSLGRHETEVCHELAWALEAREVADLCKDRHGRNEIDATHRHQRRNDRCQKPIGKRFADRLLQPPDALAGLSLRLQHLLKCKALLGMLEP